MIRNPRLFHPATQGVLAIPQQVNLLAAVSAANTAAATSLGIDLTGYEGVAQVIVNTGAITGTLDPKLQDSADNSSFADVTGLTAAQVTTASQARVISFDVRNVRRYIRFIGTIVTGPVLVSATLNAFKKASG